MSETERASAREKKVSTITIGQSTGRGHVTRLRDFTDVSRRCHAPAIRSPSQVVPFHRLNTTPAQRPRVSRYSRQLLRHRVHDDATHSCRRVRGCHDTGPGVSIINPSAGTSCIRLGYPPTGPPYKWPTLDVGQLCKGPRRRRRSSSTTVTTHRRHLLLLLLLLLPARSCLLR